MRIIFTKKQSSKEFIEEMELKYKNIETLEKEIKKEYNALKVVDLDSWKFLKENPNETIKKTHTKLTNDIKTLDLALLDIIKKEHPESITELVHLTNKDVNVIKNKVDYLNETGLIEFKENSKIPVVSFDEVTIAI